MIEPNDGSLKGSPVVFDPQRSFGQPIPPNRAFLIAIVEALRAVAR
jgi:hypothetical protein